MKLTTFITLLGNCVIFCIHDTSGAADIVSPLPKEDTTSIKYPTTTALCSAIKSDEFLELLKMNANLELVGRSVLAIIRDEYKIPPPKGVIERRLGDGIKIITESEIGIANRHESSAKDFQFLRDNWLFGSRRTAPEDAKFLEAYDSLAKDYGRAVREYVALKQEQKANLEAAESEKRRRKDVAGKELVEAWRQKQEQIRNSPAYKVSQAASRIEEGLRMIKRGQQILDRDDAVQRESGVSNLTARRSAGEIVVDGKQLVVSAFTEYRKLGGTAQTPEEVRAGTDPLKKSR